MDEKQQGPGTTAVAAPDAAVAAMDRQSAAMERLAAAFEKHAASMDAHGVILNDMMARNEKRIAEMRARAAERGIEFPPGAFPFVRVTPAQAPSAAPASEEGTGGKEG